MLLEDLGQTDVVWIRQHLVLHLDVVSGLQTRRLPELLDAVDDLSRNTLLGKPGVDLHIDNGENVVVRVGLEVLGRFVLLQTTLDDEVTFLKRDAVDDDFLGEDVLLRLLARDARKALLDAREILLQLLSEHRPVRVHAILDVVLLLVRGEDEIPDVQLLGDIGLERLYIVKIFLVAMDDDKGLEGLLDADGPPFARIPDELNDGLHALESPLDFGVKELLSDLGERQEVNASRVGPLMLLGEVGKQLLVDVVGQERGEWRETPGEGEEDLEERVESKESVLHAVLALETLAVESNVPVGSVVDKLQQSRHDSIQTVTWGKMLEKGKN